MKNSSKFCLPYITHRLLVKRQFFLMFICVAIGSIRSLIENCVDSKFSIVKNEQFIDPDHFAEYPYCGSMNTDNIFYNIMSKPSVRAVNTNKTDDESIYRWLVLLKTESWKTDRSGLSYELHCTGAVITERHVLTAGHCLCKYEDAEPLGYFSCLEGDRDQIRPGMNEMTIYGGRRFQSFFYNSHELPNDLGKYHWKVSTAYAMPNLKNFAVEKRFVQEDIGIAVIHRPYRFFDKNELLEKFPLRRANIVPICLGRKYLDLNGIILTGAGWGIQYTEYPPAESPQRNPLYSSCMASEQSLEGSRFRHCDMKSLRSGPWNNDPFKCRNTELPIGMNDDTRCELYWDRTRHYSRKKLEKLRVPKTDADNILKNSIVYIRDSNGGKIVCVASNWRNFKYGWCPLIPLPDEEIKGIEPWGVCSPSCSEDLMGTASPWPGSKLTNPGTYRQWAWKYDRRKQENCRRMLKDPLNLGTHSIDNVEDFMMCEHSILPKTQVIRFEREKHEGGTLGEIDWENPIFEKEDPPEDMLSAYTGPCKGDSGAPEWFCLRSERSPLLSEDSDGFVDEAKMVLAAVQTASSGRIYDDKQKKFRDDIPCGSNIFKGSEVFNDENDFVRFLAISQQITHPKIFDWIKEKIRLT